MKKAAKGARRGSVAASEAPPRVVDPRRGRRLADALGAAQGPAPRRPGGRSSRPSSTRPRGFRRRASSSSWGPTGSASPRPSTAAPFASPCRTRRSEPATRRLARGRRSATATGRCSFSPATRRCFGPRRSRAWSRWRRDGPSISPSSPSGRRTRRLRARRARRPGARPRSSRRRTPPPGRRGSRRSTPASTASRPAALARALEKIKRNPVTGEFYLTDAVAILAAGRGRVEAIEAEDWREAWGVNTRRDLAAAEEIERRRGVERALDAGVTVVDPATVRIGPRVALEPDVVLHPFVVAGGTDRARRGVRSPARSRGSSTRPWPPAPSSARTATSRGRGSARARGWARSRACGPVPVLEEDVRRRQLRRDEEDGPAAGRQGPAPLLPGRRRDRRRGEHRRRRHHVQLRRREEAPHDDRRRGLHRRRTRSSSRP